MTTERCPHCQQRMIENMVAIEAALAKINAAGSLPSITPTQDAETADRADRINRLIGELIKEELESYTPKGGQ